MGINLRRGLWRTWVVGSVVWVVGATIGGYYLFRDDIAVLRDERPIPRDVIKCDETTDPALRPFCDLQDQLRTAFLKLDERRYLERRQQAWANLRWGAALVLGPPVLTLLIVSAGFWVIRGYR